VHILKAREVLRGEASSGLTHLGPELILSQLIVSEVPKGVLKVLVEPLVMYSIASDDVIHWSDNLHGSGIRASDYRVGIPCPRGELLPANDPARDAISPHCLGMPSDLKHQIGGRTRHDVANLGKSPILTLLVEPVSNPANDNLITYVGKLNAPWVPFGWDDNNARIAINLCDYIPS